LEDSDPKALPYRVKIFAIDIYNAVCWKAMGEIILAPSIEDSVEIWMEHLREKGWSTLYEKPLVKNSMMVLQ